MSGQPPEADVLSLTSSPQFSAGYGVGVEHGVTIGLKIADEERRAEAEAHDRDMRRLAVALRQSPTHLELTRRRYGDAGEPARRLRARAEAQDARIWSQWPGETG